MFLTDPSTRVSFESQFGVESGDSNLSNTKGIKRDFLQLAKGLILFLLMPLTRAESLEIMDLVPTVVRASFVSNLSVTGLASASSFDPVGMLSIAGGTASGTLINSQWVLTAAHVISSTGGSHKLSGSTFVINGQSLVADYAEIMTGWAGDSSSGKDLALVHLANPYTDVAPAKYLNQNISLAGQSVIFVGYGLSGDGLSGSLAGSGGSKRAGTNILDFDGRVLGLSGSLFLADFDSGQAIHNITGSATPTAYESILAPGDSGGGLFMDYHGETILVGVNSFLASTTGSANSTYGNLAGFQSIQPNLAWIQSVSQVPEPGSMVLGVICAIVGWWAVEHIGSRKS
jgi:hypothetical protein